MRHDFFDFDIVEIEDTSKHLTFLPDIRVWTFMQVDGPAQFLFAVTNAEFFTEFDAERLHRGADEPLNGEGDRRQYDNDNSDNRCDHQGCLVRFADRVCLG